MIFDSHCHLDLMDNMTSMIEEIKQTNIGIFSVGTTPKAYIKSIELCRNISNIKVGLGFHPQLISSGYDDIDLFEKIIPTCHYIGEIGLDYRSNYIHTKDKQLLAFDNIIRLCEKQGNKIISIHSIQSVIDVINIIKKHQYQDNNIYIFHWFTGSLSQLKQLISLDCFFSINPRMLKTKSGIELLKYIPFNRMLIETDAPFTKKYCSCSVIKQDLIQVMNELSELLSIDAYNILNKNQNAVFRF